MAFNYDSAEATFTSAYLWPFLIATLKQQAPPPRRIFDIGCGNGATANMLTGLGYSVTGIDTSSSGIAAARESASGASLYEGSVYDDPAGRFGKFPVVISMEVIEHCPDSRAFMASFRDLMEDGGLGILSVPYHGYLKNLAVAATGRFDHHFDPLWEGGHLKFFSIDSLRRLFLDTGFTDFSFHRLGRIPPLAKSVAAVLRK